MTPHELQAVGYSIDVNYSPKFVGEADESPEQRYERVGSVVRCVLKHLEQQYDESEGGGGE